LKAAEKTRRNSKKTAKIILIAIISVLIILAAALTAVTYRVRNSDQILPGIRVAEIELGGLTKEEATQAMIAANWNARGDAYVTAALPAGYSVSVNTRESGAIQPIDTMVEKAYGQGRQGSFFDVIPAYLNGLQGDYDLYPETMALNEEYIKSQIATCIDTMYKALSEQPYSVDMENQTLTVVKSANGLVIDQQALYDLIVQALTEGNFGQIDYVVDESQAEDTIDLQSIHDAVYSEVKNAEYDPSTGGATQSSAGVDFDVEAAKELVRNASIGETVVIPLTIQNPQITTEELNSKLFANKLGSMTTSYSGSSSNRINNISLAAGKINGLVLNAGSSFSYNQSVGQRTAAAGFKEAGAYSDGQVVQEIGGGICQVSSTLYAAALYANLQINNRTNHYFPVSYMPDGMDATVSWQSPDFQFSNNTSYPIKIVTYCNTSSQQLTVEIWGTDETGNHVEITSQTSKFYDQNYPTVALGYTTTTYRNVYNSSNQLLSSTKEATSTYHYHQENIVYPSSSEESSESDEADSGEG